MIEGRWTWYVCPKSRLLKRAPQRAKRIAPPKPERHWLNGWEFCERAVGGGWTHVTLQPLPEGDGHCWDAFLGRNVRRCDAETLARVYGKRAIAITATRLNTAEARRLPIPIDAIRPNVQNRVIAK